MSRRYPFIKQLILEYLHTHESITGYEFSKFCKERGLSVSNGTIYPHLTYFAEIGFITGERQGKRVVYTLTERGKRIAHMHTMIPESGIRCDVHTLFHQLHSIDWNSAHDVTELLSTIESLHSGVDRYAANMKNSETPSDSRSSS